MSEVVLSAEALCYSVLGMLVVVKWDKYDPAEVWMDPWVLVRLGLTGSRMSERKGSQGCFI